MSSIKSNFSVKELDKIWKGFVTDKKDLKDFVEICKMCKEQMGQCKEILGKKKFQQVLLDTIEVYLASEGAVVKEVANGLNAMFAVLQFLMLRRKLGVDVKPAFVEKLFYCFEKWACKEEGGKYCKKILTGILYTVDCCIKVHLSGAVEDVVYPKFNEIMEVISRLENGVLGVKINFSSGEHPKNGSRSVDLTLLALEVYKNYIEKSNRNFNPKEILSNFFNKLKISIERHRFESCELECEKFSAMLGIAKVMNGKDKNFGHDFFSRFGEKIKQVFVMCVTSLSVSSVSADIEMQLQGMFENLFSVLRTTCDENNLTILNIPMVIFQLLFNTVIPNQPQKFPQKFVKALKMLTLKFVWEFYFELKLLKINISDFMIPQLVFSHSFFVDQGETEEIWEKIWKKICEPANFIKKTSNMIVEELEKNAKNSEYIQQFNFWLKSVKEKNPTIYEQMQKFGLYREIIFFLTKENSFEVEYQLVLIVSDGVRRENWKSTNMLELSKEIFQVFGKKTQSEVVEVYEILIKEILCLNNRQLLELYLDFLKTYKSNLIILSALKSFERAYKSEYFVEFLETENLNIQVFKVFIETTPLPCDNPQHVIDIWKSLLSSLFLIAKVKDFSFNDSTELSFLPTLLNLRKFPNQKKEVFTDIFDSLLKALLSENEKIIRFPPAIPLFIEMLCEDYKNLTQKHDSLMKYFKESRINFRLIATHNFFSVFFYYLMKTRNFALWEHYQDLCFHLISCHFTIFDLENWLQLYSSWPLTQAKTELLKLLSYGIKKKDFEEQIQRFSYFTPNSHLISDYSSLNLSFTKELSIVFCVYIENLEKFNILVLKCSNNTIILTLDINLVTVRINQYYQEGSVRLDRNCWNFIVVNISNKKMTTFGKHSKISVFVNGKFGEIKENKDFKLAKSNRIEKVCIGKNYGYSKEYPNFVGKISYLRLMKKHIETDILKDFYKNQENHRNPTIEDLEEGLMKAGKDLKDYILLDPFYEGLKNNREISGIYNIASIPTLNTIKVFGIRRLLMEIRKSIRSEEVLLEFFELVKNIAKHDKYLSNSMFNSHTVRFLARMLKKCDLTEDICFIITDIIQSIPKQSKALFEVIIYTNSLFECFKRNNSLLQFILESFKRFFPFTRENLFIYCNIIKHLPFDDFAKSLTLYINSEEQEDVKPLLSTILQRFDSEKQFGLIENFINTLLKLGYSFVNPVQFLAALLNMVDYLHPFSLQKTVIEAIFFGNNNQTEDLEKIFEFIQCSLDTDLDVDFLRYLMAKGFDSQSAIKEIRFCFIDIVLPRFFRNHNPEAKKFVIEKLRENQEKLQEAVFNRPIFPDWLDKYTYEKGETKEIYEFFDLLYETGQKIGNFYHIQKFFSISNKIGIYQYLVQKYNYDENIAKLLEIHEKLERPLRNNSEILKSICKTLKNSEEFRILLQDSIITFNFKELLKICHESKSFKSKPLIINYLNILLLGLDTYTPELDFKYLQKFLSKKEINYLNTKDVEEQLSKTILSVFIFSQILKKVTNGAIYLIPKLQTFVKSSKIYKKLKIFFEKFFMYIETAISEEVCSESGDVYNQKEMEIKYHQKLNSFKANQEQFLSLVHASDFQESNLSFFSDFTKLFSIIFSSFSNTKTQEKRFSEDNPLNLLSKHIDFINKLKQSAAENNNTQLFDQVLENNSRNLWKIEQDYKSFKKQLVKLQFTLDSDPTTVIKVRQIYDKFGRWSTVKPIKSKNQQIHQLELEQIYSGVSPLPQSKEFLKKIENKEVMEKGSESPDTTRISENSGISRETTIRLEKNKTNKVLIYSGYCERIKVQGSYFGRFFIGEKFLELVFEGEIRPDGVEFQGALGFTKMKVWKRRIWFENEIAEVVAKRFIHRESALEFILVNGKSYFLNFFHKKVQKVVVEFVRGWNLMQKVKVFPVDMEQFTNDWKKGQISNFEYLMILNKYSSRSLNDLSQYPVFPWIISDYKSKTFSYNETIKQNSDSPKSNTDPPKFRILKLPVGAQSEDTQKILFSKFNSIKEENLEAYHHGSHFSNSGIIVHYLLRIEPYTTQAKELQGGNFDVADRLFFSMKCAWESCTANIGGDVKELIPEVFFSPFMFNNHSGQSFGETSEGIQIQSTEKPAWAVSNWDFIVKHRNMLESNVVSKELHNWIDLVFGVKQTGKMAENSFNVFSAATYKEKFKEFCKSHNFYEIAAMTEQAYHFGQMPVQIFTKKGHPSREEVRKDFELFNFFYLDTKEDLELIASSRKMRKTGKINCCFMCNESVFVVRTDEKVTSLCRFIVKENNEALMIHSESVLQNFLAVPESTFLYNCKNFSFGKVDFRWSSNNFVIFNNKYLIAGLDSSNLIKIFDFKGKLLQTLQFHTMPVICVTCSSDTLFSAGFDMKIKSWKWDLKEVFIEGISIHGHSSPVTSLRVLDSYQIIVSASQYLVLTHDTKSGDCINKVELSAKCIDVNEIGLIAVGCVDKIVFLGVNLDRVSEYNVQTVKSVKFSFCGNFCFVGFETFVMVFDIFDMNKKVVHEGFSAFDFVIHPLEKQIYLVSNDKGEVILNILKIFSKQQRENTTQLINELV